MGRGGESSILHHLGIILGALGVLSCVGWTHPVLFFLSFFYLYLVNNRYTWRLRTRLQFKARRNAFHKAVLCESETLQWLNHTLEKVWPIFMERFASQRFLLPMVPWFLDKYKPWTARKAVVQQLYLGKNAPTFTEVSVVDQTTDDDHLVLELAMNFLSSDDMLAILDVQLRRRLGFGIWARMHVAGMHVEGRVLVGVKFIRDWPFIGRLRLSFLEPPYFQMTVKPIFNHGVDVAELPGIAGWLDKILSTAFEQSLVEPNMLVIDVEKFVSAPKETWFTVDEKRPIAFVIVEIVEGANMKPSDMNGLADPYVKGQLGPYRFQTKIQRKTLEPKWSEEFKIPITSWNVSSILSMEVFDKDQFFDDALGNCKIDIGELRDGEKHDIWMPLQNIEMGRLHITATVVPEDNGKRVKLDSKEDIGPSKTNDEIEEDEVQEQQLGTEYKVTASSELTPVSGHEKTGVWLQHQGKGSRNRHADHMVAYVSEHADTKTKAKKKSTCLRKLKKGLTAICFDCGRNPNKNETIITGKTIDLVVTTRAEKVGDKIAVGDQIVEEGSKNK